MGRSRFPGKPHKFHNKKRISVLLENVRQDNDSEDNTGCASEEVKRQNEVEGETSEREKGDNKESGEGADSKETLLKKGEDINMQMGRSEGTSTADFLPKMGPVKKTVTFGSVESCGDVINPNKKIPSKTMQPLVSIIKKKSAFKSVEHSAFHSIVKPAKLTDLSSKSNVDFGTLRAKHNKSPPVKKLLKFSYLIGGRSTSPPPDKDQVSKKFVLPTHSAHSSRVIKPNKRFIDGEESLPPSPTPVPLSQPSGKVLKKPKLILTGESGTSCYDEAYETCDSSANSNDSSDSKHLDPPINSLMPSKQPHYLDKTMGLFGTSSLKSSPPSFQDTFVNNLKTLCQISDKLSNKTDDTDVNSCDSNTEKLSKEQRKDGSSKSVILHVSRDISDVPCPSDQSSSTSESSESEASALSDSESEDSDDVKNRLTIVEKGHVQSPAPSQLLSGKVILREARLQFNTINSNNASSTNPFSSFGSTNTSGGNSPGTVACGVCNAVRFYKLVKQARKFGIYACESCRKFISKMMKMYGTLQNSPSASLQCLNEDGECQVPPSQRSQEWKLLKSSYKARCHACWLKMCLKSFQIPASSKAALQFALPHYMRPSVNVVQTVLPESTSPLRSNTTPPTTASLEEAMIEPSSATTNKNTKSATKKRVQDEEPKKADDNDVAKSTEHVEDDSLSNRKRRHTRIKVRKKDKTDNHHESDTTKRQKMELKGPRVKHVCRSASIVLGQPIATFPSSEDKETSDLSDDNSLSDVRKSEVESKNAIEDATTTVSLKSSPDIETSSHKAMETESIEDSNVDLEKLKEDSTDSFDSTMSFDNKENVASSSVNESSSEDNESKSGDVEQIADTLQKKTKTPLATICNVRQQRNNQQAKASELISIDYWESYDPEEVFSTGWGIISSLPFSIKSACFLCASKGKEKLVYCTYCCEPYHSFCVDGGCETSKYSSGWVCNRCEQCSACGERGGATTACQSCRSKFHSACLAAGRAGQRSDWPQICNACFKCKSCESSKVTKFLGSLPFCQSCFKLRQKGNYCPLCQGCYQDNDFDSKMMECGRCSRWVHAQCEGLSGEGYQLLSALPPSVEYVCRQCQTHDPLWRGMLTTYLRSKLKAVLKAMAKNKSACSLLKLTPHKSTPVARKPCVCSSPQAIRKLTFEEKLDSKAPSVSEAIKKEDISDNIFQSSLSKECIETAKGTVHRLQESLLQNNEIILSIGACETKDRNVIDFKYNDDTRQAEETMHSSINVKEIDEDDSDSSNPESTVALFKSGRSKRKTQLVNKEQRSVNQVKCSCSVSEPEPSPSFLDVKRMVNSDEYFSVKDFNRDMMDALSGLPEVNQVYKEIFSELFPWFDCENNCLNPSLEIEDENDDIESLKDEDISMFSKASGRPSSEDHTVPTLEENVNSPELTYEDISFHETRVCVLCKVLGEGDPSCEGRLLYCGQGDWIHANCALWSAEVFEEIDGSLQNIQSAISRGRMINCAKCCNKGASVGCCAKNCSETYHFACARSANCAFLDDKRVFCPQHLSEAENMVLQKDKDFDLSRPVYVELDRKKKKTCDPQKVQFLLGSLIVKSLGRIIPSVSDFEDVLMPVDFLCTRLYWSTKEPWKIVKYTIRTKLLLVEPSPAYDLGVNITLDHSLDPSKVERILAEINSWHKSLDTKIVSKKDKSPIKFGSASVSLEDYAVKQVMEHLLDIVCRQDQQDDTPEEEPQNTADLLPPELKDAIFEDLNHDLLDGISMQDIFPKLMSYEDLLAIDLKNESTFATDSNKEKFVVNLEDHKKTSDESSVSTQSLKLKKSFYVSNNNPEHWLEAKTTSQDLMEDILNSQSDVGKDSKRSKSELLIHGENLKCLANNKSRGLGWSCKLDGSLSSTLKRCKLPRSGLLSRSESNGNVVMVVDGTSDLLVSLAQTKNKIESSDESSKWLSKSDKLSCDDPATPELIIDTLDTTDQLEDPTIDKVSEKHKIGESTEHVIDFYTKIQCSPISQLDGAADYSGQSDSESDAPMSPSDVSEFDFKPIHQLDGTDDTSSSSSESNSPPREPNPTILFRPSGSDTQIAMTISPANLSSMNASGELVMRPNVDENILRIGQIEQTVRCDRCHCTYRTKDSFNRHLPNCDMMSTSESEGETPKSPDSRTLTTLQNAFNGSFIQPAYITQQNTSVFENSEQFTCPKPGMISARRTSVNTRQITINGTIVEKQSPGPSSPMNNNNDALVNSLDTSSAIKSPKMTIPQGLPQPQLMVSNVPISPIKTSSVNCSKPGMIGAGGNFNICVKPNPGIQTIQNSNQPITQILPNSGNIQVLSNSNHLLTLSAAQQNSLQGMQNKPTIMQGFPNVQTTQTITVPINSIQGISSSVPNNINPFIRPTISFQSGPTILMPTSCASKIVSPNPSQKNQIYIGSQHQKSVKKSPQVQPKAVFQAMAKGRGRALSKATPVKRQTKLDKTMPNITPNIPLGPNGPVLQFQNTGSSNQPSIIVQQVSNPNIMSYVEALQQQQQGPNMQYIATIAPQGDFKPATQYISQIPQTFQIQQTESGGLVAVPSSIPVFLPQGGVGILPQTSLQPQSVTISPQGTIQAQGPTILPQTIQTQNGTTILPQATIQTQNGTATIIPQGNIQASGPTIVSANGIQSHSNLNNAQTTLIPQSALQNTGNTIISQQPGTTILPQGAILPQGLQFCNDQVILGSTPTLEMVTDSSGCMYLTTQPMYYGLETIVQNTVMSSQQFVSTAMQGVLAQNSSFSATTTQVFQASKIEPIVEVPAGYVVVNNVPQENIVVSQASVNSQAVLPTQAVSSQSTGNSQNQKTIKTITGPNITIQPTTEKIIPNNRHTIKTVSIQPNQPILNISQPQVGGSLTIQPRNMSTVPTGKQNITIQPMQTNILHPGNVQLPGNCQLPSSFSVSALPVSVGPSVVTSANSNTNIPKTQITVSHQSPVDSNINQNESNVTTSNMVRTSMPQTMWRSPDAVNKVVSASCAVTESHTTTVKNVSCNILSGNQTMSPNNSLIQTSTINSRTYTTSVSQSNLGNKALNDVDAPSNVISINVPHSLPSSISNTSTPALSTQVQNSFTLEQQPNNVGTGKSMEHAINNPSTVDCSEQQIMASDMDNNNQTGKPSSMQMCNAHKHLSTSAENTNSNILNLPNNLMNLSMQGDKMFHMSMNSVNTSMSNQNQVICNQQAQFNNVNRNQGNNGNNCNTGQTLSQMHNHALNGNTSNNQLHCTNGNVMMNTCNQQQSFGNVCENENNNSNNMQQLMMQHHNTSMHHMINNNVSHSMHFNQGVNSGDNQQFSNQNNSSLNQQAIGQNISSNNNQPMNQNNLSNQQTMMNQVGNHLSMMNQTNMGGNMNSSHIQQNINSTNQQMAMNQNIMSSSHQSFNIGNTMSNQQTINQSSPHCSQQSLQSSINSNNSVSGNHILMNQGNQHSMMNQINPNMSSSNHHNIINQNIQMMNSQHQNNQSCSNNQIMNNMANQLSLQNSNPNHCTSLSHGMNIQNNNSNSMQMYGNQMHNMVGMNANSLMNMCNMSRPHIGNNVNHHMNLDRCNNSNDVNNGINIMQTNNNVVNERISVQINNNNTNSSNNMISNQMQLNNNQMRMGKNHPHLSCDVLNTNINQNVQYQTGNVNDQMYMMNASMSNPPNDSSNMQHMNNFNQHQGIMNQNQLVHSNHPNNLMHASSQVNKTELSQDIYQKTHMQDNISNMTLPHIVSDNLPKGNHMSNNQKQPNQHMLSVVPNHVGFSSINNGGNNGSFSDNSHIPHAQSVTTSPITNIPQIDTNRSQVTTLSGNDMITQKMSIDSHELHSCSGDSQNIEMPVINISNGSLTIPPLSNIMNKQMPQNQNNSSGCVSSIATNVTQGSHSQNTMNTSNVNNSVCQGINTINLPTQTSINLPKAPTLQSGIPTNVVNPIPQLMRPMNRVLPIHRDAQIAKAIPKPRTRVEPPKPPPHNQDMPDLNVKDEEMVVEQENKTVIETKPLRGVEIEKKPISTAVELPCLESSITESIKTETKVDEPESVNANFKILIQKKGASGNVYKISAKSIEDKENLNHDITKIHSQKLDIAKMAGKKLHNLPSIARKVNIRGKTSLDNRSTAKSTKHSPKKVVRDDGPKLIYEVYSEDGFNYSSTSLADLWGKVLEGIQLSRKQHGLSSLNYNLPQATNKIAETQILGLNNNAIKFLIEQLPGAGQCTKYKPRYGCKLQNVWQPDTEILRESPYGCARAGPALRRSCSDTFSWLASQHRDPPLPLLEAQGIVSRRFASTTLPMAMRFRHLMETSKLTVGVYRSHIHRRGLFCRRDIEAGEMVIEYAGEVIRAALADQREKKYEAARGGRGVNGCYMFRVDDHLVVDATMKGNAARFINHSCDPNCFSKVVDILGHKHIIIFALRKINQGEELTYDYKFPFEDVKIPCTCGAKKCRKYLN